MEIVEVVDSKQNINSSDAELLPFWSIRGLRARWATNEFRKMLFNILLLAWSWSLGEGTFFIQISTTTLAATNFANWYLATIPIGCMLLTGTIYSLILPRAITRFGYRPPLYFGAFMGMTGAAICIVATWFKLFWLLTVGAAVLGGQVPCTLYYRLVALQFSTADFAPKAIALVVAGGCLSSVIGPEIAKHTVNALPKLYSGAYLTTLCECALLFFTMTIIQFPNIKKTDYTAVSVSLADEQNQTTNNKNTNRSLFAIGTQRTFIVAAIGGFVSWSAMVIQMSATPLAMAGVGYTFVQATTAVELHSLGMFVPSFFTGTLCNWFGIRTVIIFGFLTQLTGAILFQRGFEIHHFNVGLIVVGIGWNFGYVGASALLTHSHLLEEKARAHALYEAIVMSGISISLFSSAFMQQYFGWMFLTGRIIPAYLLVSLSILVVDTTFVFHKTKSLKKEVIENEIH